MCTRAPMLLLTILWFDVACALLTADASKPAGLSRGMSSSSRHTSRTLLKRPSVLKLERPSVKAHPRRALPLNRTMMSSTKSVSSSSLEAGRGRKRLSCQERKDEFQKAFDATVIPEEEDPCQNGEENCVVAITVYCLNRHCDPFYTNGIKNNIKAMRKVLPGWKLRVYTDGSIPRSLRNEITSNISTEVIVQGVRGVFAGVFWRFFAASDPTVDRVLMRDSDNIVTLREKALVNEWIRSGKKYHSIKDHPEHTAALLAGMWGVCKKKGEKVAIPRNVIEDPARNGELSRYMKKKGGDQQFLFERVYWRARADLIEHASFQCTRFPHSVRPIPVPRRGGRDIVGYPNNYTSEDELYECGNSVDKVYENMRKELTDVAPLECRPANHTDWEYN